MFDRDVDRTIDGVAREMASGEPAIDVRARVLARIDAHQRGGKRRAQHRWRPALAGLAVAAGAIAMLFLRGERRLEPDATRAPETTAITAAGSERPVVRLKPDTTGTTDATTPPTRAHPPPRGVDAAPSEVAALAPPRLNVESIALGELDPPSSIEIEQLETITPIAVAPLGESAGGPNDAGEKGDQR